MKKVISFAAFALLAVFTTFSLAACGGDDEESNGGMTESEVRAALIGWWKADAKYLTNHTYLGGTQGIADQYAIRYSDNGDVDGFFHIKEGVTGYYSKYTDKWVHVVHCSAATISDFYAKGGGPIWPDEKNPSKGSITLVSDRVAGSPPYSGFDGKQFKAYAGIDEGLCTFTKAAMESTSYEEDVKCDY